MYAVMKVLLVLCGFLLPLASAVKYTEFCLLNNIKSVTVDACPNADSNTPCEITRGKNIFVSIEFTSPVDSDSATNIIGGMVVNSLGDVCGTTLLDCPLRAGQTNTLKFPIGVPQGSSKEYLSILLVKKFPEFKPLVCLELQVKYKN